jgi:hypothetical protein
VRNRRLTKSEIETAMQLFDKVRSELDQLSGGDPELLFALRRRIYIRLMYEERSTPAKRNKLKAGKWKAQKGLCAICSKEMALKHSELDRTKASAGYTFENTRLVHHECHVADQAEKKFKD